MSEQELLPCRHGNEAKRHPNSAKCIFANAEGATMYEACCAVQGADGRDARALWNLAMEPRPPSAELLKTQQNVIESVRGERDTARAEVTRLGHALGQLKQELGLHRLLLDILTMPEPEDETVSHNLAALPVVKQMEWGR